MLSQHGSAVGVGLALPQNAHTCPFEPEIKASDSREERANRQHSRGLVAITVSLGETLSSFKGDLLLRTPRQVTGRVELSDHKSQSATKQISFKLQRFDLLQFFYRQLGPPSEQTATG